MDGISHGLFWRKQNIKRLFKKILFLCGCDAKFNFKWMKWGFKLKKYIMKIKKKLIRIELVSMELNHFGEIAGLFWQIGCHNSRFVLFCSFWKLFTIRMIKSVKVFPFSFWKIITSFLYYFIKFKPWHKHAKWRQVI